MVEARTKIQVMYAKEIRFISDNTFFRCFTMVNGIPFLTDISGTEMNGDRLREMHLIYYYFFFLQCYNLHIKVLAIEHRCSS